MEVRYKNIPLTVVFESEKHLSKSKRNKASFYAESLFNKAVSLSYKGVNSFSISKKDVGDLSFDLPPWFDRLKTIYIDKKTHNIYVPTRLYSNSHPIFFGGGVKIKRIEDS